MLFFILSLIASAHAFMNEEEILKATKKPRAQNEVMSAHPSAVQIKLKDLIDKDTLKKLDKEKNTFPAVEPSLSPQSKFTFIKKVYAFSTAKPSPTPSIQKIDLRSKDCYVVSQWNGTCTAHGLVAAIENKTSCDTKLSERHLWSMYQQYNVVPAINSALKNKITSNAIWPHQSLTPVTQINGKKLLTKINSLGGSVIKTIEALKRGNPVYVAMSTPKDLLTCMPVVRESTLVDKEGGHAMSISGFIGDYPSGVLILKNSWGAGCGDKGYQYLPMSYCQKEGAYCLFYEVQEVL